MARLNESTAPVEPIEILKRRFVRQNREIARVNSIQSLRIRSLESEVSHLLSENVSLREQSISLKQELERYEAAKMLHDGVYDVKAKIDGKLAELNNLVADLGALPRKCGKFYQEPAEPSESRHSRPSIFDLRRKADTEYNATPEDGKLPVILEDKCYPRKSLELQELDTLVENTPDTPGSPVIEDIPPNEMEDDNHFLNSGLPEGLTDFQIMNPDAEETDALLPPTLETRKKRKPSPIAASKTEHTLDPGPAIARRDSKLSTKSGAKRKFVSEDDELFESTPVDEEDDFQYNRPSHLQHQDDQTMPANFENSPSRKQVDKKRGSRENGPSKRKVLEPKNTNHSAVPQSKLHASQDQKAQSIISLKNENHRYPAGKKDHQISNKAENPKSYNFDQYTPKDENAKSIAKYEPSKENQNSATSDIPKDEAPNQARPSRRQRAVVSYAEPNLRDKMRRPTNEFADAVKTGDARRNSSTQGLHMKGSDADEANRGDRHDSSGLDTLDGTGTVSQRKRKTLPANTDDPSSIYDISYEMAQKYPISSTQDEHAVRNEGGKQTRRHSSNLRSSRRVSRSHDGDDYLSQAYPQDGSDMKSMSVPTDKRLLGADSRAQLGDAQLDMEQDESFNSDGKQIRRGQRGGARRRSMML